MNGASSGCGLCMSDSAGVIYLDLIWHDGHCQVHRLVSRVRTNLFVSHLQPLPALIRAYLCRHQRHGWIGDERVRRDAPDGCYLGG